MGLSVCDKSAQWHTDTYLSAIKAHDLLKASIYI